MTPISTSWPTSLVSAMTDVSVVIVFHAEGPLAVPALASMSDLVNAARSVGLTVEAIAMLDRGDALTRHVLEEAGGWLDARVDVDFGDLGCSRNHGAQLASGDYLAFLDGDDLWGSDWLVSAHRVATASGQPSEAIWHPEHLLFFDRGDFDRPSLGELPHPGTRSFWLTHRSSTEPDFDQRILLFENFWSANVFALRSVYLRYPYRPVDRESGHGIEDWSWNIETIWAGLPHLVVPRTVHLIRLKESGSLNARNQADGLLPFIPDGIGLGV